MRAAFEHDPDAIELVRRVFGHSDFYHLEKIARPVKNAKESLVHSRMVVEGKLKTQVWKRSVEGR